MNGDMIGSITYRQAEEAEQSGFSRFLSFYAVMHLEEEMEGKNTVNTGALVLKPRYWGIFRCCQETSERLDFSHFER